KALDPVIRFLNALDDIIYGKILPLLGGNPQALFGGVPPATNSSNALGSSYNSNAFPDSPEMRAYRKKHEETTESLQKMQDAVDGVNMSLLRMNSGSLGGNAGLHGGLGSTSDWTIYGPGVAGDQPGQRTYDWDSYHSIGHIKGVPYDLEAGDTAMGYDYATKHYHIRPGE